MFLPKRYNHARKSSHQYHKDVKFKMASTLFSIHAHKILMPRRSFYEKNCESGCHTLVFEPWRLNLCAPPLQSLLLCTPLSVAFYLQMFVALLSFVCRSSLPCLLLFSHESPPTLFSKLLFSSLSSSPMSIAILSIWQRARFIM